ncbi:MAG TPA: ECF-type sigma factor [Pirellulales bacterium]|nr:ECF-type sigma factor [Pirellulales bacterium]
MTNQPTSIECISGSSPRQAADLLPLVYEELRRLAGSRLAREKPGHTLSATALVHEAYLRLARDGAEKRFDNRGHFFVAAAEAMRRILIENARRKMRDRHGGGRRRVELSENDVQAPQEPADVLAVDEALTQLAAHDPPAADVAKLRLYAGLSVEEAAEALGLSRATAYRHWTYARAALRCSLGSDNG